jgi:hypothetical protein
MDKFFFNNKQKSQQNIIYNQLLRHYLKLVNNDLILELLVNNFYPKNQYKNKSFGLFYKNKVFTLSDLWGEYLQLWRRTQEEYYLDHMFTTSPYIKNLNSQILNSYVINFKQSLDYSDFNFLNKTININFLEYSLQYQTKLNIQLLNLFDRISFMYEHTQYTHQKTARGVLLRWLSEILYPWYSSIILTLTMWFFFLTKLFYLLSIIISLPALFSLYIYIFFTDSLSNFDMETAWQQFSFFFFFQEFFFYFIDISLEKDYIILIDKIIWSSIYYFFLYIFFFEPHLVLLTHEYTYIEEAAFEDEEEMYAEDLHEISIDRILELLLNYSDHDFTNEEQNNYNIKSENSDEFREFDQASDDLVSLFICVVSFFVGYTYLIENQNDFDLVDISEISDIYFSEFTDRGGTMFYDEMNNSDIISNPQTQFAIEPFLSYASESDVSYGLYEYSKDVSLLNDALLSEEGTLFDIFLFGDLIESLMLNIGSQHYIMDNIVFYYSLYISGVDFVELFVFIFMLLYVLIYFKINYDYYCFIENNYRARFYLNKMLLFGFEHSVTNTFTEMDYMSLDLSQNILKLEKEKEVDDLLFQGYPVNFLKYTREYNPFTYNADYILKVLSTYNDFFVIPEDSMSQNFIDNEFYTNENFSNNSEDLVSGEKVNLEETENEGEIGYWIDTNSFILELSKQTFVDFEIIDNNFNELKNYVSEDVQNHFEKDIIFFKLDREEMALDDEDAYFDDDLVDFLDEISKNDSNYRVFFDAASKFGFYRNNFEKDVLTFLQNKNNKSLIYEEFEKIDNTGAFIEEGYIPILPGDFSFYTNNKQFYLKMLDTDFFLKFQLVQNTSDKQFQLDFFISNFLMARSQLNREKNGFKELFDFIYDNFPEKKSGIQSENQKADVDFAFIEQNVSLFEEFFLFDINLFENFFMPQYEKTEIYSIEQIFFLNPISVDSLLLKQKAIVCNFLEETNYSKFIKEIKETDVKDFDFEKILELIQFFKNFNFFLYFPKVADYYYWEKIFFFLKREFVMEEINLTLYKTICTKKFIKSKNIPENTFLQIILFFTNLSLFKKLFLFFFFKDKTKVFSSNVLMNYNNKLLNNSFSFFYFYNILLNNYFFSTKLFDSNKQNSTLLYYYFFVLNEKQTAKYTFDKLFDTSTNDFLQGSFKDFTSELQYPIYENMIHSIEETFSNMITNFDALFFLKKKSDLSTNTFILNNTYQQKNYFTDYLNFEKEYFLQNQMYLKEFVTDSQLIIEDVESDTNYQEIDDQELFNDELYQTTRRRLFVNYFFDNTRFNTFFLDGWGTWYFLNYNLYEDIATLNYDPFYASEILSQYNEDDNLSLYTTIVKEKRITETVYEPDIIPDYSDVFGNLDNFEEDLLESGVLFEVLPKIVLIILICFDLCLLFFGYYYYWCVLLLPTTNELVFFESIFLFLQYDYVKELSRNVVFNNFYLIFFNSFYIPILSDIFSSLLFLISKAVIIGTSIKIEHDLYEQFMYFQKCADQIEKFFLYWYNYGVTFYIENFSEYFLMRELTGKINLHKKFLYNYLLNVKNIVILKTEITHNYIFFNTCELFIYILNQIIFFQKVNENLLLLNLLFTKVVLTFPITKFLINLFFVLKIFFINFKIFFCSRILLFTFDSFFFYKFYVWIFNFIYMFYLNKYYYYLYLINAYYWIFFSFIFYFNYDFVFFSLLNFFIVLHKFFFPTVSIIFNLELIYSYLFLQILLICDFISLQIHGIFLILTIYKKTLLLSSLDFYMDNNTFNKLVQNNMYTEFLKEKNYLQKFTIIMTLNNFFHYIIYFLYKSYTFICEVEQYFQYIKIQKKNLTFSIIFYKSNLLNYFGYNIRYLFEIFIYEKKIFNILIILLKLFLNSIVILIQNILFFFCSWIINCKKYFYIVYYCININTNNFLNKIPHVFINYLELMYSNKEIKLVNNIDFSFHRAWESIVESDNYVDNSIDQNIYNL